MRKVCFDCNFESLEDVDVCPKCGKKLTQKKESGGLSALDTWPSSRFFYVGLICFLFPFLRFVISIMFSFIFHVSSFGYSDSLFLVGFVIILFGKKFYKDDKRINLMFWIYIISIILFVVLVFIILAFVIMNYFDK